MDWHTVGKTDRGTDIQVNSKTNGLIDKWA
jgi:hypothetical protein